MRDLHQIISSNNAADGYYALGKATEDLPVGAKLPRTLIDQLVGLAALADPDKAAQGLAQAIGEACTKAVRERGYK